jgi:hypothetical protein
VSKLQPQVSHNLFAPAYVGQKALPARHRHALSYLHHQQVYRFQVHRAKLELLTQPTTIQLQAHTKNLHLITNYLASVETHFPHNLFQATEHRSFKFPASSPTSWQENKSPDAGIGAFHIYAFHIYVDSPPLSAHTLLEPPS